MDVVDAFWPKIYPLLYETWMQELSSEWLLEFWSTVDIGTSILITLTTSGSAVAGWQLWQSPNGKVWWGTLAGIASLVSILKTALTVPTRVKDQANLRSRFLHIRLVLEALVQDLPTLDFGGAKQQFEDLRSQYHEALQSTSPDVALTKITRRSLQTNLGAIMKERGYIQ